jgi:hypothetical protein
VAETKKTEKLEKYVVVDGPINHDLELYQNGAVVELPAKAAKRLKDEKKVKPFKKDGEEE